MKIWILFIWWLLICWMVVILDLMLILVIFEKGILLYLLFILECCLVSKLSEWILDMLEWIVLFIWMCIGIFFVVLIRDFLMVFLSEYLSCCVIIVWLRFVCCVFFLLIENVSFGVCLSILLWEWMMFGVLVMICWIWLL